jgi:hypothetical protein
MSGIPPTVRVFIAGMSGSGKSVLAWRLYLSRFPRRILLDQTGEWSDPNRYPKGYPGPDIVVATVPELSWALHKYAPTGKWTIVVELGLDEMGELVDYLIPMPRLELSPIARCHGAVILVDEVDLVAPPRSLKQEIRTLYRRSRHVGLSIVSTTQRPEAVSREVSAQSGQVISLALVEPTAIDYMEDITGRELAAGLPAWTRRHPHGGLWWERATGRTLWLGEAGELVPVSAPSASAPGDGVEPGDLEPDPEPDPSAQPPKGRR